MNKPPTPFTPPGGAPSLARLARSRLGFGPRPGDADFNDVPSLHAYIDAQLEPESMDDSACEAYVAGMSRADYDGFQMPPLDAGTQQILDYVAVTTAYAQGELGRYLRAATFARALLSRRQLLEIMVDFWSNHLNTTIDDSVHKYWEDHHVIRQYALGNFRDLLGASAKSPSMLEYLSNRYSDGANPNENYARELLELHAMGTTVRIPGHPRLGQPNYSEADVHALAQALSGWTNTRTEFEEFEFNDTDAWPSHHWPAKQLVLGRAEPLILPYGGVEQGEIALDAISAHESTAYFLAMKLCQRFISDDPAGFCPDVIALGMNAFLQSHGDIRATLRAILKADVPGHDFKSSWGQKVKRPFEFIVSAARAMNAAGWPPPAPPDDLVDWELEGLVEALGQPLFAFPAPIGYPDVMFAWMNTNQVFGRWTLGNVLTRRYFGELSNTGQLGSTAPPNAALDAFIGGGTRNATQAVDHLLSAFLGRSIDPEDRMVLIGWLSTGGPATSVTSANLVLRQLIGVLIASPYFQWR